MKYVFVLPCAHSSSVTGIMMDEALTIKNNGHEIEIYYCDNLLNVCKSNYLGKRSKCISCSMKHKYLLKKYFKDENCHSLREVALKAKIEEPVLIFNYSTVNEIKKLTFNNINIGLGCYSTYVSLTRNCDPLIDLNFKNYFDLILNEAVKVVSVFNHINLKLGDTTVCLFNGRFMDSRPLVEICAASKVQFRCYEAGFTKEQKIKKLFFENSLPHDMSTFAEKVNYYWQKSSDSEKKESISKIFFERKANNLSAGDVVYTKHQEKDLLPEDWDPLKHNITIFNSSEDEFVGIGGEYDNHSLYPSQIEGIEAISRLLKDRDDIHLYIRIHPNLRNNPYKYHTKLAELESRFRNLTVIPAGSPISSYTLLKKSQKTIVFNSTMGVESVYAGVPTILLTAAQYYYLDIAYKPETENQLLEFLIKPLEPKPKLDALKYAYYCLYIEEAYFDVINFTDLKEVKILNRELYFVKYTKLFGSNLLFWIYFKVISKIRTLFSDRKIVSSLPVAER